MHLTDNESRLLKILATVLVISGVALYFVFQPPKIKTIPGNSTTSPEKGDTQNVNVYNGSSGGGSRSRGSSGGGGGGSSSSSTSGSISVSTFESHNSIKSCWVLIEGEVYDITGYLQNISNPEEAVLYCGTFGFKEGYLGDSEEAKNNVIRQSIKMGKIG